MMTRAINTREKKLWLLTGIVLFFIFGSLFLPRPVQLFLSSVEVQFVLFLTGFVSVLLAVLVYGIKWRPARTEVFIWIGLFAALTFFIFRLGAPERSHMLEYSVLAIFLYEAIKERWAFNPGLNLFLSFVLTFAIGIIDELIQIALPQRVFDVEDIVFNGFAALLALTAARILSWASRRFRKKDLLG